MAQCGQMIEGNVVAFACDLESGHDGPHRAYENERSVRERAKWESDQRAAATAEAARETLDQFQGPAQTTAERYTDGATPPPGPATTPVNWERGEPVFETDLPRGEEPRPEHERAVVTAERTDGSFTFRQASPAEAKVAGLTSEPTKQREGDQPLPHVTEDEYVQDRIIAKIRALVEQGGIDPKSAEGIIDQMIESKAVGMQRYGTALQTFNGRDCLQDAIEEARDLYVYLSSMQQAREAQREYLVEVIQQAMEAEWMVGAAEERVGTPKEHTTRLAEVAIDAILKATGGFQT